MKCLQTGMKQEAVQEESSRAYSRDMPNQDDNNAKAFSGFYQPAGPLIRSASPGGSTASSASAPSAAGAVGGAPVGVAAPLHMGVVAPPTATVQPTVVTSVAASSNNNGRTTSSSSTSANTIRDSGEFSPSQKEQPGTVVTK